ncbi:MAG: heat-inducible transcription repressor HrcA [Candidatus Raymondbacteria bacterium RifOxyA12_full_50_37]|uniref:Heat-inducible transcription repressor HrcA n=1 Tax=Candidatus Raymondbacteria bacterium RIFOXYD12_FULL_49_13 TaxID=1817890 RepID=A0A1F7FIA8_UNCRA|nr:MAG: heat-inducible transcription repressor HrcA [Candidatus Raymondbacteria bacterium RifOxyA12_full_50_37]OGJ87474.1 MAG: heat-inducible transcription repressor HrcA [Candidatus Raymondbacteria bacterium RIFOXYA2_FULL_49_16]OGJ94898.1 MAG: heat-inducible transcription repressor HrcA [Candidatus Raymondbacteria bacterium RifOxyC12_full_50_8]OGJ96414.1 MAG: heat-inducible transcription repressor HrcA [Candidatus Raymondbacteria bacterium RIFOXYC2_FULL_50_21]OGJ99571.1 MAG: heat-inducible tra
METEKLNDRESCVLQTLVRDYISSAEPTSSRTVSRKSGLMLSPASIRNIITDLEEKGYVSQPHTSAGRIPTNRGYRYYVDYLIEIAGLSTKEQGEVDGTCSSLVSSVEEITSATAKLLSSMSAELGLVLAPRFYKGVFKKLDIVPLSEKNILLVLAIESGLVNTVTCEIKSVYDEKELERACAFINERLEGKQLSEIKERLEEIVRTEDSKTISAVRLFVDNARDLFDFPDKKIIHVEGTSNIVSQPEFSTLERVGSVIGLLERKELLVSPLEKRMKDGVYITIGEENTEDNLEQYSIVTANYSIGGISGIKGTLGIMGPPRMQYERLISLVDYTARFLTDRFVH